MLSTAWPQKARSREGPVVQVGRLVGARGMGRTQVGSAVWNQSHRQTKDPYMP